MLSRTYSTSFEIGESRLSATISPCSFMYPNYGLQLQITLEGGGVCYLLNKQVLAVNATEADVDAMLAHVKLKPCSRCGEPAFDPASIDTNRADLCEFCFMKMNAKYAKASEAEAKKVARKDISMKNSGYTHRVDAWVHPESGSDSMVTMYYGDAPTKSSIESQLKKQGSCVLDDYTVVPL